MAVLNGVFRVVCRDCDLELVGTSEQVKMKIAAHISRGHSVGLD